VHSCIVSYAGGRGRRVVVSGQSWEKSVRHYLKNKFRKRAEGIFQEAEFLPISTTHKKVGFMMRNQK
jgi:hypothetical protein